MPEIIEKEIEHLSKRLENVEHTVYGNGQRGLKAELIELKPKLRRSRKLQYGR